jgi:hypothetical protein
MIRFQLYQLVATWTLEVVEFTEVNKSGAPVILCPFMRFSCDQLQDEGDPKQKQSVSQRKNYLDVQA